MSPLVTLSTASTFPESTSASFEMAARLGYDGVEVMVLNDAVSQDPDALLRLRDEYAIPVTSIHAPCLLISQRVWGSLQCSLPSLRLSMSVARRIALRR